MQLSIVNYVKYLKKKSVLTEKEIEINNFYFTLKLPTI